MGRDQGRLDAGVFLALQAHLVLQAAQHAVGAGGAPRPGP
jgi:hypothetical protein